MRAALGRGGLNAHRRRPAQNFGVWSSAVTGDEHWGDRNQTLDHRNPPLGRHLWPAHIRERTRMLVPGHGRYLADHRVREARLDVEGSPPSAACMSLERWRTAWAFLASVADFSQASTVHLTVQDDPLAVFRGRISQNRTLCDRRRPRGAGSGR